MARGLRVALTLLALARSADGATMLERTLDITLAGDTIVQEALVVVALDEPGDLELWRSYRIDLDDNVTLESCTAEVVLADGTVVERVPRRSFEREESTGFGLYTSAWTQVIPFAKARVGQRLRVATTIRVELPFRAVSLPLQQPVVQRRLEITVRGGGGQLRWRVHPAAAGLDAIESDDRLELRAANLSAAAGTGSLVLRLAWDPRVGWPGIGSWYGELTAARTPPSAVVRKLAGELCATTQGRRGCFERLADQVRRRVRYEAVAIGQGGWVPSPPDEVLARGWGDCKDKSQLLVQLLAAQGIASHLALLASGSAEPIDPTFATPNQVNHCIVAVPVGEIETRPGDPVVDGYFLLDPSVDRGGIEWLSPTDQGRHVLVVAGGGSRLLEVPELFEHEQRRLTIDGAVDRQGDLHGRVELRLKGARAVPWLRAADTVSPQQLEDEARGKLLLALLPGAVVGEVRWHVNESPVPELAVSATVDLAGAVRGQPDRRWFRPPLLTALPEPAALVGPGQGVRLAAGVERTSVRLELPEGWCPAQSWEQREDNELGSYLVTVTAAASTVEVAHELALRQSWVDAARLPQLHELALAERQAGLRRVRLRCGEGATEP